MNQTNQTSQPRQSRIGERIIRRSADILTAGEIAKSCSVSVGIVRKWIDSGRLRGYCVPGSRDRRVHRADLIAFMLGEGMFRVIGTLTLAKGKVIHSATVTERWGGVVARLDLIGRDLRADDPGVTGADYEVKVGSDAIVALLVDAGFKFVDGR